MGKGPCRYSLPDGEEPIAGSTMNSLPKTLVHCAVLALILLPCRADETATVFDPIAVKKQLAPLNMQASTPISKTTQKYYDYYDLDIRGTRHSIGTFNSSNTVLAAQIFVPENSKATVILVHGYYDHVGIHRHLIRHLVDKKYTVAIYDQPGHGLSDGERASIEDFAEYVDAFKSFLRICKAEFGGPIHVVAHSMGCSAVIDHLLNSGTTGIGEVVLISPLVRSAAWHVSGLGTGLIGFAVDSVPRVFRGNSGDKEFLEFMKNDPLQTKRVPTKWITALRTWNKRVVDSRPTDKAIRVIQGTGDTTVARRYNMRFLRKKFPNAEVIMVKNGGHQLINELPEMRNKVLTMVSDHLAGRSEQKKNRSNM